MYNTELPSRAELPTTAQLNRSTLIAALLASAILALVVLPSEYGYDPTGVGSLVGLTQMGQIKMQLAQEAAQDAAASASKGNAGLEARSVGGPAPATPSTSEPLAEPATAEPAAAEPAEEQVALPGDAQQNATSSSEWKDEVSFTLPPGQGVEVKLVMKEGAQARFHWTANGAVVNYDTHGDGKGQKISYEQGRGVGEKEGILKAAFAGNHGWFWRNRTQADVTVTLRAAGEYLELKRKM